MQSCFCWPVFCCCCFSFFFLWHFFFFLLWHLWHVEVPALRVEWELQLGPYHSLSNNRSKPHLRQGQILNPLRKARDQTHILMETTLGPTPLSYNGNSSAGLFFKTRSSNLVSFIVTTLWYWNHPRMCGAPRHTSFSVSPISYFREMGFSLHDFPWVPKKADSNSC